MTGLLSPLDLGHATPVGPSLWRKQILPRGSIDYKGRRIDFTGDYLAGLAKAFTDGAYDTVPLVFADEKNRHTMDPTRATGEVVGMEPTGDGLDVIVRADDKAATVLRTNPKVGISARIIESLQRADGRSWPAAIQHALITFDPRITGMRPWQAVSLSSDEEDVLDLSAYPYAAPGGDDPEEESDMQFSDDETRRLKQLLALMDDDSESDDPAANDADDAASGASDSDGDTAAGDDQPTATDAELDALAADLLADSAPADAADQQPREVAASDDTSSAVELANARYEEMQVQLATVQAELDRKNYENEKDRFTRLGVPPVITELARPLLTGSGVVELSNGSSVDAGKIARDMLTEFGKQVTLLDLSGEIGSGAEPDDEDTRQRETDAFLTAAKAQFGLD